MTGGTKQTEWLNKRQAQNFMAAHRFAEEIGRPLSIALTINFTHTSCSAERVSKAFERIRDNHFTRWFRYQSERARRLGKPEFGRPTYTWVVEAKDGYAHVHWNLYIPPSLAKQFLSNIERWVSRAAGEIEKPYGAIHSKTITNTRGLAKYCMKGIDPYHAALNYIRPEYQGTVYGKRCGVSMNLGQSARKTFKALRKAA